MHTLVHICIHMRTCAYTHFPRLLAYQHLFMLVNAASPPPPLPLVLLMNNNTLILAHTHKQTYTHSYVILQPDSCYMAD